MNIQQLEYIVALDNLKSFSKAAVACFVTQATLSTMVKRLEEELNLTLFDRKTQPILTTDSGLEIIEEAKKILFHANRIKQKSSELKGRIEGALKIGIIPTVSSNLLHRLMPSLLEKHPHLKISIQELTTQNIVEQLKNGQLDMGIVSTPLDLVDFEEVILYYEKLKVYGKLHEKEIKYLKPNDMTSEKIWLMEEGNCISNQIINICSLKNKPLNSNLNFHPNSFESLINMVDHFNGVTLIPELYFLDLSQDRKKLVTDFIAPYPVREISIIYHRPYAKLRLINAVKEEVLLRIKPLLETFVLKKEEMVIAKI